MSGHDPFTIVTPRLRLVAATAAQLASELNDHAGMSEQVGAIVPEEWPPPLTLDAIPFWIESARVDPSTRGWLSWYWIARDTVEGETLVGGGGFFGPPTEDGTVEIGYSVLEPFQGRGYATAGVAALLDWAFGDPRIARVIAHTDESNVPSIRVLRRRGFLAVGPGEEPGSLRFARVRDG